MGTVHVSRFPVKLGTYDFYLNRDLEHHIFWVLFIQTKRTILWFQFIFFLSKNESHWYSLFCTSVVPNTNKILVLHNNWVLSAYIWDEVGLLHWEFLTLFVSSITSWTELQICVVFGIKFLYSLFILYLKLLTCKVIYN